MLGISRVLPQTPATPWLKASAGQWSLPSCSCSLVRCIFLPSPIICFAINSFPTSNLTSFSLQRGQLPPGEEDNPRAKGSRVLSSEKLAGSGFILLLAALGRGCLTANWNLIVIIFDFVTFLLGRVKPPFPLLSICANSPLSAQGVLTSLCEEIPVW